MLDFSNKAPVGHTAKHCPHEVQTVSDRFIPNIGPTSVLNPLSIVPIALTVWIIEHMVSHLLHRIHLLGSWYMDGDDFGLIVNSDISPSNFCVLTPKSDATCWSSQFVFLSQNRQSFGWFDKISSTTDFLDFTACGEFVTISIPSVATVLQDVTSLLFIFASSTTQTLHDPGILKYPISCKFRWQSVGICILLSLQIL